MTNLHYSRSVAEFGSPLAVAVALAARTVAIQQE